MGMSTYVKAYISDSDPTYQAHKKVFLACYEADISLPAETAAYFGIHINEAYLGVLNEKLEIEIPNNRISTSDASGYEVLVQDIPEGTYKISFINIW